MKKSVSDTHKIRNADIVICSYMPDDPTLADQRLRFLSEQLKLLTEWCYYKEICVIASNWTTDALKMLKVFAVPTVIFKERKYKAEKHNLVMQAIKSVKNKAVLILGDDVVPTKMEGITLNPIKELQAWIRHPETMPAPCIFFSCKGTLRDTYYKERMKKGKRFSNTAAVTDWAFMIRSDFQVIMDENEMDGYESEGHMASDFPPYQLNSDAMLRFKAASLGYEVLKDQELFFETFQSTSSDKNSVWYVNREDRRKGVQFTNAFVERCWPWLFHGTQPVWQLRGRNAEKCVMLGLLNESEHGYYPNGPALKAQWDRQQAKRNSLSDLL